MALKKQKEEKSEKEEYTKEQMRNFVGEISLAGGVEAWLVGKGAIRVNSEGRWVVIRKVDGSIPYIELSAIIAKIDERDRRIAFAEAEQIKDQTGSYPINEKLLKIVADCKEMLRNK